MSVVKYVGAVMSRPLWVIAHRYIGLVMVFFLLVAGLTGSLLAFNDELDSIINHSMMKVSNPQQLPPIDPFELRAKVQQQYPNASIDYVGLHEEKNRAAIFYLSPLPDAKKPLADDQVYINPYNGEITGQRLWGDITQGGKNFMPFIYRLHYSLALGTVGNYLFGIIALLWTIDCFIGAYLTFPQRQRQRNVQRTKTKNWFVRWWPAWTLRVKSGGYKLNVDIHRAGGLWPWAMLFVLAWSSVGFNLREVYMPVMKTFFQFQTEEESITPLTSSRLKPALDWQAARERGQYLMQQNAEQKHFTIMHEESIFYNSSTGIYRYTVKSDRDIRESGLTHIFFDSDNGEQRALYLPSGAASGDTISMWLSTFHMARIWGLPMKIFVCTVGLIVTALSITGVVIWLKKRRARYSNKRSTIKINAQASQKVASQI